jgi:hypothetical protein
MKQSKPWEGRRREGGVVRTEGRWEYEPTFVVLAADGNAGKVHPNWDFFLDHCAERIVFKIFSTHREREAERERQRERQRDRGSETETERDRGRESETERDMERQRQR